MRFSDETFASEAITCNAVHNVLFNTFCEVYAKNLLAVLAGKGLTCLSEMVASASLALATLGALLWRLTGMAPEFLIINFYDICFYSKQIILIPVN